MSKKRKGIFLTNPYSRPPSAIFWWSFKCEFILVDRHIYTLMTEHPAGHRLAACRGSISSNMVPHSSSNTLRCYLLRFIYRHWILYNIKIEWEFEVKSVKSPVEKPKRTQKKDSSTTLPGQFTPESFSAKASSFHAIWDFVFLQEALDTQSQGVYCDQPIMSLQRLEPEYRHVICDPVNTT